MSFFITASMLFSLYVTPSVPFSLYVTPSMPLRTSDNTSEAPNTWKWTMPPASSAEPNTTLVVLRSTSINTSEAPNTWRWTMPHKTAPETMPTLEPSTKIHNHTVVVTITSTPESPTSTRILKAQTTWTSFVAVGNENRDAIMVQHEPCAQGEVEVDFNCPAGVHCCRFA
ncbi:MAG: hypothetical protein LQ340_005751 [Diploschistes diacapsis]|nr:MAG: hypothetical protein LQ340_005751 [Diploschistes diacapsis]